MGDVSARLVGGGLRTVTNVSFREGKRANNRKTICSYYTCVNIVFQILISLEILFHSNISYFTAHFVQIPFIHIIIIFTRLTTGM